MRTTTVDPVAVERATTGHLPWPALNVKERRAAVAATRHLTAVQAAAWLGTTPRTVERQRRAAMPGAQINASYTLEVPIPDLSAGLCFGAVDDSLWFADTRTVEARASREQAKAVCRRCPVVEACRAWALATRQPAGVFGGLDEDERAALRKRRRPPNQRDRERASAQAEHLAAQLEQQAVAS